MLRALNGQVERVFNSDRKDPHRGQRKLAGDRSRKAKSQIISTDFLVSEQKYRAKDVG
jgi:hypothetical protein